MKKIVFGMNIEDRAAERFDSDAMIIQRVTSEQKKAIEQADEALEAVAKKVSISPVLRFIGMAAAAGVPLCAKVIQGMLKKRTWEEFMEQMPWMFYILIGCGVVVLLVLLISFIKGKTVINRYDVQLAIENIDRVHEQSRKMLNVPLDSEYVDVFSCVYRINDGRRTIIKKDDVTYLNNKCHVSREGDLLCVTDTIMKLGIPISGISSICRINQRIVASKWNKDVKCNRGEYREYKITMTKQEQPIFKYYYALCFTYNGEEYELYFPPYELPLFERLTGKRAAE